MRALGPLLIVAPSANRREVLYENNWQFRLGVWGVGSLFAISAWGQAPAPQPPVAEPAPVTQPAPADPAAPAYPPVAAEPAPPPPPPPPVQAEATATTTMAPAPMPPQVDDDDDGERDHDPGERPFAVGWFGVSEIPLATGGGGRTSVIAPALGIRYWFTDVVGLDAGLGIAVAGGSSEAGGTSVDAPTASGGLLHVGIPLALSCGKHFCFELIPEINAGFAQMTIEDPAGGPDTDLSGNRFDVGARVGGELHFGFIDVPQLSLVASVGLFYSRESWKAEVDGADPATSTQFAFATSTQGDPWAIFTNNISALYYF